MIIKSTPNERNILNILITKIYKQEALVDRPTETIPLLQEPIEVINNAYYVQSAVHKTSSVLGMDEVFVVIILKHIVDLLLKCITRDPHDHKFI